MVTKPEKIQSHKEIYGLNSLGDHLTSDRQPTEHLSYMTKATIWRVPSCSPLHWRSWDHERVVYNSGSGSTHLLDPVAAETLKILETKSATPPELAERVARSLALDSKGKLATYIEDLLPKLEKLGLVERIES